MLRSDLESNVLFVNNAAQLAHLAESAVYTDEKLVIALGGSERLISNEDVLKIALSLPKLKYPVIRIELGWMKQNNVIEMIAEVSKKCSAEIELVINSSTKVITVGSIMQCVNAIPESNISLFTLRDNHLLTPEVVNALAEVLQRGNRHRGPFSLDVSWSSIGDMGLIAFAEALKSGRCPPYLDINIASTEFGTKGIIALIAALKSKDCPSDLTLHFGSPPLDLFSAMKTEDVLALVDALCSQACNRNLTLAFSRGNFILYNVFTGHAIIDHSIECVRAITKAAVQNPSLFIIGIDQQQENSEDRFPDHFAQEMQIISLCNRRNQLIKDYPILQLAYANMNNNLFTLKDHCLFAVANRADSAQLLSFNIPNELREELMELKGILSELASLVAQIGMDNLIMQPRESDSHDAKPTSMLGMS